MEIAKSNGSIQDILFLGKTDEETVEVEYLYGKNIPGWLVSPLYVITKQFWINRGNVSYIGKAIDIRIITYNNGTTKEYYFLGINFGTGKTYFWNVWSFDSRRVLESILTGDEFYWVECNIPPNLSNVINAYTCLTKLGDNVFMVGDFYKMQMFWEEIKEKVFRGF